MYGLSANTGDKMKHQKAVWSLRHSILIDALFCDGDTLLHMYSHPYSLCGSHSAVAGPHGEPGQGSDPG